MKLIKVLWRLFVAFILVLSLVMNIAFFIGGSLYQLASSAVRATTGIRAISPEKSLDEKQKLVCAMRVPTREELWESMKSSPKTAWTSARNAIPTLEDVKSVKFPDVDWEGLLSGALAKTGDAWEATKSGVSSAGSSTMETGKGIWERLWDGELIEEAE